MAKPRLILLYLFLQAGIQAAAEGLKMEAEEGMPSMTLVSPAFLNEREIPNRYTCAGANVSPPLAWDSIPPQTQSLAVICHDPDAKTGSRVHWIVFNISPAIRELPENVSIFRDLPGARCGRNSYRGNEYQGPCQPSGATNRYLFDIYALDCPLKLEMGCFINELMSAMRGHLLARGELMGRCSN